MPTISQFYGIVILMYYNDHPPAHFHAQFGEHEAVIELAALTVTRGSLPVRAMNLVREWAEQHRQELEEDWVLCRTRQIPKKIAPLS